MANENFSVKNIDSGFFEHFSRCFDCLGNSASVEIDNLIASEDSNLSESWKTAKETASSIAEKGRSLSEKIYAELENYKVQTLVNELNTEEAVTSINASLEESRNKLNEIVF